MSPCWHSEHCAQKLKLADTSGSTPVEPDTCAQTAPLYRASVLGTQRDERRMVTNLGAVCKRGHRSAQLSLHVADSSAPLESCPGSWNRGGQSLQWQLCVYGGQRLVHQLQSFVRLEKSANCRTCDLCRLDYTTPAVDGCTPVSAVHCNTFCGWQRRMSWGPGCCRGNRSPSWVP